MNECATYICADSQVSIYSYDVCESNCTSDCVLDVDYCYPTEPFEYYPIEYNGRDSQEQFKLGIKEDIIFADSAPLEEEMKYFLDIHQQLLG